MKPDLDAIRARCEAATAGPWRVDGSIYDEDCNEHLAPYGLEGPNGRLIWSSGGGEYAHPEMATAQFIANARTDIPALLAYIDELERRTTYTVGETEWAQRIATLEHMLAEERENVDTLRRERDEAQEAYREARASRWHVSKKWDEALKEIERLRTENEDMGRALNEARAEVEHAYREGGALYEAKIAEREAFRCGAEAMREAAMGAAWHSSAMALHKKINDLPIPDET